MSSTRWYGFDRLVYPVDIEEGQNTILVDNTERDIPPGTYYLRTGGPDDDFDDAYPPLIDSIVSAVPDIDSAAWSAPSGYEFLESITWVGSSEWSFQFSFEDFFTFPPELLGFPPDIDTDVSSVTDGTDEIIAGTRSAKGAWIATPIHGEIASDKRAWWEGETHLSTERVYENTAGVSARNRVRHRRLEWENVPGLRVHGQSERGEQPDYQALAQVGDPSDSFESEGVGVGLDQVYLAVSDLSEFLVYHDVDQTDLAPIDGQVEAVRLANVQFCESFDEWYDEQTRAGEIYTVDLEVVVVDGGWGY